jgi:hypothetical protein
MSAKNSKQTSRPVLEELEQRLVPTVTYHNYGGVLPNVQVQPVFYGSGWSTQANYPTIGKIDNFLGYLVNSSYMDLMNYEGYHIGHGSVSSPLGYNYKVGSTLSDSSIASYVSGVNPYLPANSQRLYLVFTQPGTAVYAGSTHEAGYHTFTSNGALYAVVSYPGGGNPYAIPNDSNVFDNLTGVASHEIAEAVTDPRPLYWYGTWYGGWFDSRTGPTGGEIGDLAAYQFARLNGYAVQDLANQNDQAMIPYGSTVLKTTSAVARAANGATPPAIPVFAPAPTLQTPAVFSAPSASVTGLQTPPAGKQLHPAADFPADLLHGAAHGLSGEDAPGQDATLAWWLWVSEQGAGGAA